MYGLSLLVVGGGTSGSVIASRLSEDPDIRVLVLEAGKADDDIFESHVIDTPGLSYSLVGSSVDWKYETEPQQHCCNGLSEKVYDKKRPFKQIIILAFHLKLF